MKGMISISISVSGWSLQYFPTAGPKNSFCSSEIATTILPLLLGTPVSACSGAGAEDAQAVKEPMHKSPAKISADVFFILHSS